MRKRVIASTALAALRVSSALCSVPVEQVEVYQDEGAGDTEYAPVNFNGQLSYTAGSNGGSFANLTFYADPALSTAVSTHAQQVGIDFYGNTTVAYPYVGNIYCTSADQFLNVVLNIPDPNCTGVYPVPGTTAGVTFFGGAKVINNSYIGAEATTTAYLDDNRRLDYMISQADVVWVAAAVTGGTGITQPQYLAWSNFNSLAVSAEQYSSQNFSPTGSPGKQHADLSIPGTNLDSWAVAAVSGDATALWGSAQVFNQNDAQHGVVIRSLLMAGADKTTYTRPAANASTGALDPINGAGQPDYDTSRAILEAGEKPILTNGTAGSIATSQSGWAYGNIALNAQSVVLFQTTNPIYGLTASLNWDVTSLASGGNLNTTSGALVFPNFTLEVRPVTYSSTTGTYTLGASETDYTLHSTIPNDNVQYLYSTSTLPAGSYAFLLQDSVAAATVGFSYTLSTAVASSWNGTSGSWTSSGNWTNSVPNGNAAHVTFPQTAAPVTITLDGDVTVGQLTFNSSNGFTIATGVIQPGVTDTLKFEEIGDGPNYFPAIFVNAGNQVISAPVHFDYGLTINVSSGASLNLSNSVTGYINLTKAGAGLLLLNGTDAVTTGTTIINAGTLSLGSAGSLNAPVTVNGGTLNFAANTGTGYLLRNQQLAINSGAQVTLSPAVVLANRQVLVSPAFSIAGSSNSWTGRLDLANNDLDIPNGNLATITNQIAQGYNGGKGGYWNGAEGIVSSSAASDTTRLTALGAIQNSANGNPSGNALYSTFDGQSVLATDVLVKFTYYGDANLSGYVDGSDYSLIDNGYSMDKLNPASLTGWYNGDFNYDGTINGSDFTLIDNSYNSEGAAITDALVTAQIADSIRSSTAVPEPTSLCVGALVFLGLLGRRKRVPHLASPKIAQSVSDFVVDRDVAERYLAQGERGGAWA